MCIRDRIDTDEEGVSSIVTLFDENINIVRSIASNIDGEYAFEDVEAGNYFVQFELPLGLDFVESKVGGANSLADSEVVQANGLTELVSIALGEQIGGINAGFTENEEEPEEETTISGRLWLDTNGNNLIDAHEEGVGSIVTLFDEDINIVISVVSDSNGDYIFEDVEAGNYFVQFELPLGLEFVESKVGGAASLTDSEVVQANGLTEIVSISIGQEIEHINAGFREITVEEDEASISGFVWFDANIDGLIGITETGLPNVKVYLRDQDRELIEETTTNSEGLYEFTDLEGGLYTLNFDLLDGFVFTTENAAVGTETDSEVSETDGYTSIYNLDDDQELTGINAGLRIDAPSPILPSSISGFTWFDTDQDGLVDDTEMGIPDVKVYLRDADSLLISETTTDFEGLYKFESLESGTYILNFDRVDGLIYTTAKAAVGTTTDSDVRESDGFTRFYNLGDDQQLAGINAGYKTETGTASISGLAWLDENSNGLIGLSEQGIANVKVYLRDQDSLLIAETITDDEGNYTFTELLAGRYILNFEEQEDRIYTVAKAAVGTVWDSDVRETDGYTRFYNLLEDQELAGVNAGYRDRPFGWPLSSISGLAWFDENENGTVGAAENGISEVRIQLRDVGGAVISEVSTDSEGRYSFFEIESGSYVVHFEELPSLTYTESDALSGTVWDSDVNPSNGLSQVYEIIEREIIVGVNAGYINAPVVMQSASISGLAWFDEDEDGLVGQQESGLPEVRVYLRDQDSILITETITGADGIYDFSNLEAGNYLLNFDSVDGFIYTTAKAAVGTETDSDVRESDGFTRLYALGAAENLTGINAGYKLQEIAPEPGTDIINGVVWEDINGNGIFDSDEVGTPNSRVRLMSEDGDVLQTNFTDEEGRYSFTTLSNGNYKVDFLLPLDVELTEKGVGTDATLDSDLENGLVTELIAIPSDEGIGVNAGYYFPVAISGWVWLDFNNDGIQDEDETGTNNFLINLFDSNGTFINRVFTNFNTDGEQGHYIFNGIVPGSYYVQVFAQQGVTYSPAFQAANDLDSDITGANGFGTTELIKLQSRETTENIDIGLILEPSTIGDLLWIDQNGNGVQDDGESGLNGIVVELYNNEGEKVNETITGTIDGADGRYLFVDMYPTEYYVQFILGDEYEVTGSDLGGVDSKDSDINNSNGFGSTSIFLLSPGEEDLDIDGGVFLKSSIGNRVWHDRNLDGLQDDNEPGVRAVDVALFKLVNGGEPTMIDRQTTNALGSYRFENLSDGDYYVVFSPDEFWQFTSTKVGNDDENDNDADATGVTEIITIENNQSREDVDAGLVRPSNQLAGHVWLDEDEDGLFSFEETLLEGIILQLLNETNSVIDETVTGRAGRYVFDDLDDGSYFIKMALTTEYALTEKDFGLDDINDSDFNADGETELIIFDNGETVERHVDAGLIKEGNFKSTIYPNPTSGDLLNLRSYKDERYQSKIGRLQVFDEQGALKQSVKFDISEVDGSYEKAVDISSLPPGFYYLKLDQGRKSEFLKLIKIN